MDEPFQPSSEQNSGKQEIVEQYGECRNEGPLRFDIST